MEGAERFTKDYEGICLRVVNLLIKIRQPNIRMLPFSYWMAEVKGPFMVEHEGQWALLYVGPRGLSVVRFSSNYGFQAESHITRFNYTPVILLVPFLRPSLPHRPILKVPWDLCGLRPNRSSVLTDNSRRERPKRTFSMCGAEALDKAQNEDVLPEQD